MAWLSAAAPIVALLLVGKFILAPSLGPQRSPASRPVSMHAPFVQRLTDRVVARWPHDPTAFTQGLEVWRGADACRTGNTLDDDEKGVADKLSADDKEEIENTINEALDWLDENPEADKDEYTSKQKEVEAIANPIMRNVYQGAGGPGGGEEEEDYDFGDDEL